jgi:hypothetical protein
MLLVRPDLVKTVGFVRVINAGKRAFCCVNILYIIVSFIFKCAFKICRLKCSAATMVTRVREFIDIPLVRVLLIRC